MPDKDIVQNYVTELKRGNLVLAVLGSLDTPHYGYALLQTLQELRISCLKHGRKCKKV